MFLKQRGFKALPITKGFNFSPVALHPNITVRHAIKTFAVRGESAGVDLQTVHDFCSRIPEICSDFEPCNIFNCDETDLYTSEF
jgi:hypothetical protein